MRLVIDGIMGHDLIGKAIFWKSFRRLFYGRVNVIDIESLFTTPNVYGIREREEKVTGRGGKKDC